MKVKAHMAMVLNLDQCLGCHACSIPCKNAWSARPGNEYMWFNNVESKPGTGYPRHWENQGLGHGGWTVKNAGQLQLRAGNKAVRMASIFANPYLPPLSDYGEPWQYDYAHLTASADGRHLPTARLYSAVSGEGMTPQWSCNWEDDLAGASDAGLDDPNFSGLEAKVYLQFKHVFLLHLPRLCEHCLNPACVSSCPSGAVYKRDEDGIVLTDQTRCRSWRLCVSGCPYKKIYFNWKEHHAEKCLFCYPRVESGQAPLCAQACTGRIRYVGVLLYDADRVHQAASKLQEHDLYGAQRELFLDPYDPEVIRQAGADGIAHSFMEAARHSPVRKLICDWQLALPLHPEFRTLPMVWYIPPSSPLLEAGVNNEDNLEHMRIPLRYLANLLAAGNEAPVRAVLRKLLTLRRYMRLRRLTRHAAHLLHEDSVHNGLRTGLHSVGFSEETALDICHLLTTARAEERFVIPTVHREDAQAEQIATLRGQSGFPGLGFPPQKCIDEGAES